VLLTGVLLVIAGRLAQLQGFQASAYAEQAERQRLRTIPLTAVRGTITDRHGATLAQDVEARAVYADPAGVADPARLARVLAPLLRQPAATIEPKLRSGGRFVYLARGLDIAVGDGVDRLALPGVDVLAERRRAYPGGTLASNVIGFTRFGDADRIEGGGGIESAHDILLRGTDGERRQETDPAGRPIPSAQALEEKPVPGSSIRLTLDRDIQWAAQGAIADAVRTSEADGGTVVVMDPKTGDVLAMADAPQFDPDEVARADPAALGNRSTRDVYEPGSTNKVITMAAALDRGVVTPTTPVTVPPVLRVGGRSFRDAEPHGVEHLTAAGVLVRSSNIGTIMIARRLGSDALEQALRSFGLGAPTGLDFPGESAGLIAPSSQWSLAQATTIPYGQGMSATAVQMAAVYATIASGGVRVAPRLIDATVDPDGTEHVTPVAAGGRVVKPETARMLTRMLESVVTEDGTAPDAAVEGYRVAGKTGTAYRSDPSCGCYRGYVPSFVGFAPADAPRLVVEVVLDNPKKGHYGGAVAAPVFQKVMRFALTTLGITPTGASPEPLAIETPR
jgi:cell division protein FtsI (penicillin-binding protein 3)